MTLNNYSKSCSSPFLDIFLNTLERSIGRSQKILIALLENIRQNSKIAGNREAVRNLIKDANLISGYKKLAFLSFEEIFKIMSASIAES